MSVTVRYFTLRLFRIMNKFVQKFSLSYFVILFLSSCENQYLILVNSDGSAEVEQGYYYKTQEEDNKRLKQSELILRYDSMPYTSPPLKFEISDIDSLGGFLTYFREDYVQFFDYQNELRIRFAGGQPYIDPAMEIDLAFIIETERKIKEVRSPIIKTAVKGDNEILVYSKHKTLLELEKPAEVIIRFDL